ncbi:hypothetical protein [Nocardioides nanhaiensis]
MTPRRAGLLSFVLACSALPALAGTASAAPPTCGGELATIVGTAGADVLTGTPGPDVIAGLAGFDRIDGGGGDDVICGGDGADRLTGGEGDDTLLAGAARYVSDRGGDGYRPDVLEGGPGDDLLDIGPVEPNSVGDSTGVLRYDRAPGRVVVDLSAGQASGEGADRIVVRPGTRILGSPFDDRLVGGVHGDQIYGGPGSDVVLGNGGNDVLYGDPEIAGDPAAAGQDDDVAGGPGKDVLLGSQGSDTLRGGPGIDDLQAYGAGAQQVLGGPDQDFVYVNVDASTGWRLEGGGAVGDSLTVYLPGQRPGRQPVVGVDLLRERLSLGGVAIGSVTGFGRVAVGERVPLRLVGTDGPEVVAGSVDAPLVARTRGGNDRVLGSHRADLIDTGAGRDEVDGSLGRDTCRRAEVVRRCETR